RRWFFHNEKALRGVGKADTDRPPFGHETNHCCFNPHRSHTCAPGGGAIELALRDGGRLCEVCDETSRASSAQGRAPSVCTDQFSAGDPAFRMENKHRDYGVLGRRTGGRKQSGAEFSELMGFELAGELRRFR